ncbi:MAG: SRPBCC family protein [Planctomycetes bacterium]|nr:SRPBCC family protein [Planctomycetota bacterium]
MKAIRLVLFGFLLVLVGATVLAQFQRADWTSERSLVVPAPPERVHAWLDDLEHWPAILAADGGPPLAPKYGPKTRGAGADFEAEGPQGKWTLAIVASDVRQGLDYRVGFQGGSNSIDGTVRFAAEAGGTRVTLHEGGEVGWGPIERFLRGMIEKGHAEELGRRLERLARELARPDAPGDASGAPPTPGAVPAAAPAKDE